MTSNSNEDRQEAARQARLRRHDLVQELMDRYRDMAPIPPRPPRPRCAVCGSDWMDKGLTVCHECTELRKIIDLIDPNMEQRSELIHAIRTRIEAEERGRDE